MPEPALSLTISNLDAVGHLKEELALFALELHTYFVQALEKLKEEIN